jgi:luciferase family oxidoreductase group 1
VDCVALTIGVLDQSPVAEGATGADALHNTIDLARLADDLGYHRYWVAEHHGGPMLASAAPEVLIGPIAAATRSIRVGSGGVMLPHYSPFKVAEAFSILAALYPGRIDLALGRASGTDPLTTFALQRDRSKAMVDDFPQQLAELLAYFEDELPPEHPFVRLPKFLPGRPHTPDVWLLGSSPQSAIWAAQLGLPYAFADFINPDGVEIVRSYQEQFADGVRAPRPHTLVAAWVICAETDAEAQRLAASSRMTLRLLRRGQLIAVPPPEKALRYLESEGVDAAGRSDPAPARRGIIGSPDSVKAGLEDLAQAYGADELMVVTITHDHGARRRSYELIAEAFGLERGQAPERSASMPPIVPM